MTKPLTPSQMKKHPVKHLKTRVEQDALKKKGNIIGHFRLRVGRPPKESSSLAATAAASSSSAATVSMSVSAFFSKGTKRKVVSLDGSKKKQRKQNVKWELHPEILQAHIDARGTKKVVPLTDSLFYPPCTTVNDYIRRLNKHEEATGEKLCVAKWIDRYKETPGPTTLMSNEIRDRKQNIIVSRYARNNSLKRLDILEIISAVDVHSS